MTQEQQWFEEFSSLMERTLVNAWRRKLDTSDKDGFTIGFTNNGAEWSFVFAVRKVLDRDLNRFDWLNTSSSTEPIDMSISGWKKPEDDEEYEPPQSIATKMCLDMLDNLVEMDEEYDK